MSKWLWVSALQIFPTTSGGTLRSLALVNSLRRHGIDVRVHSLTGRKPDYKSRRPSGVQLWPSGTEEYVERNVPSAVRWVGGYALPAPLWITAQLGLETASPASALASTSLRANLKWCDTIVADFPFTYSVFGAPSLRGKLRILNTHNVEHHFFPDRGWGSRAVRATVREVERRAIRSCNILVTCCVSDAQFFENWVGRKSVLVPNGVDIRRFDGVERERVPARRALGIDDQVKVFLFTGSRWGPNQEAFEYLLQFAREHAQLLTDHQIHLLVVGNVAREPIQLPAFTATGRVDRVEPYFAAADAAINPLLSGIGTNVKMGEFMALRLPIISTAIGARGFAFVDGQTGFLFERDELASVLIRVRRLFAENPERLRAIADHAYEQNEGVINMDSCVRPLVEAAENMRPRPSAEPSRRPLVHPGE